MGLDIRLPLGILFTLLGALLAGYGLVTDPAIYQRALGINVNLCWGSVMLLFGVIMLTLSLRAQRSRPAPTRERHEIGRTDA